MTELKDGFLNLNKPFGVTSHDCVAKVRRSLKLKRVGHGGTLDPAATGVLPIALGKATRLLQYLQQGKAYHATIRLGLKTTTDDLEGETVLTQSLPNLQLDTIKQALPQFLGEIEQIPPIYSAIQVQGRRLYEMARAGEAVEVQPRLIKIYSIEILDWRSGEHPEVDLAITCGPGTYIRAIARDLGAALQTGGTLAALIRTESSGFYLTDSLKLTDLEIQMQNHSFHPTPPETALKHLPVERLPATAAKQWCQGQQIAIPNTDLADEDVVQVYEETGRFLGIGRVADKFNNPLLTPQMVFEPA